MRAAHQRDLRDLGVPTVTPARGATWPRACGSAAGSGRRPARHGAGHGGGSSSPADSAHDDLRVWRLFVEVRVMMPRSASGVLPRRGRRRRKGPGRDESRAIDLTSVDHGGPRPLLLAKEGRSVTFFVDGERDVSAGSDQTSVRQARLASSGGKPSAGRPRLRVVTRWLPRPRRRRRGAVELSLRKISLRLGPERGSRPQARNGGSLKIHSDAHARATGGQRCHVGWVLCLKRLPRVFLFWGTLAIFRRRRASLGLRQEPQVLPWCRAAGLQRLVRGPRGTASFRPPAAATGAVRGSSISCR